MLYDSAEPQYFSKQPVEVNLITIPTLATNVRILNNLLFGKWDSVLGGSETGTDLEIPVISLQHNGNANFVVNKWQSNDEEILIKISVSTQGILYFIILLTSSKYIQSCYRDKFRYV